MPGETPKTLTEKLAAWHVAKKGYQTGTVPEAAPLLEAADHVLTYSDGLAFSILCLVDRDAHPDRRFSLSPERLRELGQACLRHTGTANGAKLPVVIQLVEVRAGPLAPDDEARLRALRPKGFRLTKVHLSAWAVDSSSREVWTNQRWNLRRGALRRLLATPGRLEAELLQPEPVFALPERRFPLAAVALLALFTLVFAGEQLVQVRPRTGFLTPDITTLIAWGGLSRDLALAGGWYRLLSCAFLHADPMHLFFNGVAFGMAGLFLESLTGPAWFLALFLLSALGGSLCSIALHGDQLTVGASGGILGLIAGALAFARRLPRGAPRVQLQTGALQVLVPSLIPAFTGSSGAPVDLGAHFGGAIAGALVGLLLSASWRPEEPNPPWRGLARTLVLAAIAVLGVGAVESARAFPELILESQLAPEERFADFDSALKQSAELVREFPHDPRARYVRAISLAEAQKTVEAEGELRSGLAERLLRRAYEPKLEIGMRKLLGQLLGADGHGAEAAAAVAPACSLGTGGGVPKELEPLGICPAR
ncbi:MAG: rhomboid family intramembrane serine protease [Deltaproteobacteria bacterium]